jgi:hypothetical protein
MLALLVVWVLVPPATFLLTCVERLVLLVARRWVAASRRTIWLLSELQTYVLSFLVVVYGSDLIYSFSSLQVSELAEEQELRDLFERFGRVTRVFLARDRETQRAKGFAFISYADRGDAARACEKMDGCTCSPLSRPRLWSPWSSRDTKTNHLFFSFPRCSRLPPPYSSRRVRQAHYLDSLPVFSFTTHFFGWILFSFYLSGGPSSMLKLFPLKCMID